MTSSSGNASSFLSNGDKMDDPTKRQLFTDIYDDSMWLIHLVENLLSVSRLRVFMATLRKKLEGAPGSPQYIQTHVGVGYRMVRV